MLDAVHERIVRGRHKITQVVTQGITIVYHASNGDGRGLSPLGNEAADNAKEVLVDLLAEMLRPQTTRDLVKRVVFCEQASDQKLLRFQIRGGCWL